MSYPDDMRDQRSECTCGCGWPEWYRSKFSNIAFGALLVVAGLIWLGGKVGWFSTEWLSSGIVWPSILIAVGVWVVLGTALAKRGSQS